ncbi:MAG: cobalamin B12-binding domain-containing protein [Deltaproteobacteria bacterium]|nr:cobalamin B12-binding domain-containing protein [Nannocystaceae bacterium]
MTGVAAATLRAWERRYGVPVPSRTDSSYRVYSEADVEMIRKLRRLCDEGMAPAEAAKLVFEEGESTPAPAAPAEGEDAFAAIQSAIVDAVDRFDPRLLERKLERASSLGLPTAVVDRVLRGALVEIGDRWHAGRMTVAQEHLATEAMLGTVRRLLPLVQPEGDARSAVLACFADDDHSFAVHALAVHLSSWGWHTVMLGARTPAAAVRHAVRELAPELVGLSCTVAPAPHRARELVDEYADACDATPWIVGGAAVRAFAERVVARGGHVADDPDPKVIRALVDRITTRGRTHKRG